MENTFEIFYDFTNNECYSMLQDFEKLKTEIEVEVKWRAFPKDQKSSKSVYIVSKWADENNLGDIFRQTVYYYYFVLQKDINLNDVLKEIIIKTGIYEIKLEYILVNEKYIKLFEEDLQRGSELGINGVPAILYNGKIVGYDELKKKLLEKNINTEEQRRRA